MCDLRLEFPHFYLTHNPASGLTTTFYPDNTYCPCPVVPEDQIHAYQLSIATNRPIPPQQHRFEHELWHHLVGIHVYGERSSPIIYREAHLIAQPHLDHVWKSPAHEEWLVAALCHRVHGDQSYDYGAYQYLAVECGIDVNCLLSIARSLIVGIYSLR